MSSDGVHLTSTTASSYNVGINTTSPAYTLDVAGACRAGTLLTSTMSITTTVDQQANIVSSYTSGANGYMHPLNIVAPALSSNEASLFQIGQNLSQNNSMYMGFVYQSAASTSNYATFGFYGNDKIINMTAARNVGVNTTSPAYTLDVAGSCRVTGSLSVMNSSGPAMYLYSSSANTRINIDGGNAYQSGISFQSAGTESAVLYRPANSTNMRMYTSTSGDLMTWTNTSPGMVGILNNAPAYTLDVNGSCRVTGTSVLAQPAWIAVTFQNGFANLGATPQTQCAYMKDSMGFVHFARCHYKLKRAKLPDSLYFACRLQNKYIS